MKRQIALLFCIFFANLHLAKCNELALDAIFKEHWPLSRNQKSYLIDGKVLATAKVDSFSEKNKKLQSLDFNTAAINPKPCHKILRKLSVYEDIHHHLSFVEKSSYDEDKKEIYLLLQASVLPYKMSLKFKIPRITKAGEYPYRFEGGIFDQLHGVIRVYDWNKRCVFHTSAKWSGKDTGIPDLAVELFSETLSKIGFEKLFRAYRY